MSTRILKLITIILLNVLFISFFLIFTLLTSIKFHLLNYSQVTSSFAKNNVYEKIPGFLDSALKEKENELGKEEKEAYGAIAKTITPEVAKRTLETNLKEIYNFLDGKTDDIQLYLPLKETGLDQFIKLKNERISINGLFRQNSQLNQAEKLKGVTKLILLGWFVVLGLILFQLFLSYKLAKNKGVGIPLIICGVLLTIISILAKFFLYQMSRDLTSSIEPSQRLIAMLASSILPEIAFTWTIAGVSIAVIGTLFLILSKKTP